MDDLDKAASTALLRLQELSSRVERADTVFGELEQRLTETASRMESDWAEVGEAAAALMGRAQEEDGSVDEQSAEAVNAVRRLEAAASAAASEIGEGTGDAAQEVERWAEHVAQAQPRVTSLREQTGEAVRQLVERAQEIEDDLAETLTELKQFLEGDVANDLAELRTEVEERVDAVMTAIEDECQEPLEETYQEWEQWLTAVDGAVEKGFTDAREHLDTVLGEVLDECAERHREALDEVKDLAQDLAGALGKLEEAAVSRRAELEAASSSAEDALEQTDQRLASMTAAVNGVKELLARFSFVQL
jgi:ABC-type transporter Mla subunit MlaD